MQNIYFAPYEGHDVAEMGRIAAALYDTVAAETGFNPQGDLPIKVHFGEKGNTTFIPATTYDPLIDLLQARHIAPLFIETNVLYRGARTTTTRHLELAKAHGFTRLPIVIADGETGTDHDEVPIQGEIFKTCRIGKAYGHYSHFIVASHFKGHTMAGFGGALKQLAMGFASRAGKMAQHSGISPVVKAEKCIQCGICVEKCDFDAIRLDPTAIIDDDRCVGCAGCIAVCPEGAIRNRWNATRFPERIAEYAFGASRNKEILYLTFLVSITADCDCIGEHMDPVVPNIGILAGRDPVALDAACIDLILQRTGENPFVKGMATLEHAETLGFGSVEYNLITP